METFGRSIEPTSLSTHSYLNFASMIKLTLYWTLALSLSECAQAKLKLAEDHDLEKKGVDWREECPFVELV